MKELILGGARSGKSRFAEWRAEQNSAEVVYIATATVGDEAMAERIDLHRQRRSGHWQVVEEPLYLADVLKLHAAAGRCLLVDCLTLWLTNLLCHENKQLLEQQFTVLLSTLANLPGEIVFVSNEVGMGIVPMGELSRQFQDQTGLLHQELAEQCDRVTLVVAGLPTLLKPSNYPGFICNEH